MSFVGRNNNKIINRPSGGGNKKQGLAPKATHFFRPLSRGSSYSTNSGSGQDTILPVLIETAAAPDGFWYVAKGIKI